jgi:hypothetical protein
MNKLIAIVAAMGLGLVSLSAMAGDVSAEFRWGDSVNQYKVEVNETVDAVVTKVKLTGEIETEQAYRNGLVQSLFNVGAGVPVSYAGYTITPFLQIGDKLITNTTDTVFYGVGAKASRQVFGPVSAEVAYRYRGELSGKPIAERRYMIAAKYELTSKNVFGVQFYEYSGTIIDHRYGVSYTHKF